MSNEEKILSLLEEHSRQFQQLNDRIGRLEAGQAQLREDLTKVAFIQENEVMKNIQHIAEGVDVINERWERAKVEERLEKLEDNSDATKMAWSTLARDVAQLKKAR